MQSDHDSTHSRTTPDGCPPPSALEDAARGRGLPEHLVAHLGACEPCRERLARVRDNEAFLDAVVAGLGGRPDPTSGRGLLTDIIPGYHITGEIHAGSQGVVYRAVQLKTNRPAAIKVLRGGGLAGPRQRARFEREIEIVASLSHPNIVQVFASIPMAGGGYAFAMELIEGVPLDQWQPPGASAPARREAVLRLFTKLCDAVQHAHHNLIAHRDLKPDNVIVDAAGEPHIVDFGIAKTAGWRGENPTLTGEFAGTPAYASPEQLSGRPQDIDLRTDIYSLGVMLYRTLTGRYPHGNATDVLEIARAIRDDEPTPPRAVDPTIGGELNAVLLRALARDKTRRYQTAVGLARDLSHLLAGEAVDAKRDSGLYLLRKALRRNRRLLSFAGVGAAAVVAAAVGVVVMKANIERERLNAHYEAAQARLAKESAANEQRRADAIASLVQTLSGTTAWDSSTGAMLTRRQVRTDLHSGFGDAPSEALLLNMFGAISARRGTLPDAEAVLREGRVRQIMAFGEASPPVAQTMHDLASVLLRRLRLVEAELYAREALALRGQVLGADHESTGRTRELLASILVAAARDDEAAVLCPQVAPGDWRQFTARECDALCDRAIALGARGRRGEALAMSVTALAGRLATQNEDEPPFVQNAREVAALIESLPPAEAANALSDGPVPALAEAFGTGDMGSLARCLRDVAAGCEFAADPTVKSGRTHALENIVAAKRALLGPDSASVARSLAALGWEYVFTGAESSASESLEEALTIFAAASPPDRMAVKNLCRTVAGATSADGDSDRAGRLYEFSILLTRDVPAEIADPFWSVNELTFAARFYAIGTNSARAEVLLRQGIDEAPRLAGPDDVRVVRATSDLAATLHRMGRHEEAMKLSTQAMDALRALPDQTSRPHFKFMIMNHGLVLSGAGRDEEAERALMEGYAAWNLPATQGPEHAEKVAALRDVARRLGHHALADKLDAELNRRTPRPAH